jgi:phosphoenolpyruvate carboxylase
MVLAKSDLALASRYAELMSDMKMRKDFQHHQADGTITTVSADPEYR